MQLYKWCIKILKYFDLVSITNIFVIVVVVVDNVYKRILVELFIIDKGDSFCRLEKNIIFILFKMLKMGSQF